jgi:cytochrome c peroxidase
MTFLFAKTWRLRRQPLYLLGYGLLCLCTAITAACHRPPPERAGADEELIARGKAIFFNETFGGNGRTCGTCHREENNFTIDPAFIATLPDDDPLFVAEFNPELKDHFENPDLMRQSGLIRVNADGFDDLAHNFVLRGVPHILGLRFSVNSELGPHTGWAGDGAPGDASLRAFAAGAVIQHFPRTLNRIPGVDFRLPTAAELDALAAYQLSLGRQSELSLPLALKSKPAAWGQAIFNDPARGKCSICHFKGGANGDPRIFGAKAGNLNFNTGVENISRRPQDLTGDWLPPDDGFGAPGDGTFNTPSLIEAADTGPFFHNNSVNTIEAAVAFYNSDAFNNSSAGQSIRAETGSGIKLDASQVAAVAGFLRVINALENIRQSIRLLENFLANHPLTAKEGAKLLRRAIAETRDSAMVLKGGGLHPEVVDCLTDATRSAQKALHGIFFKDRYVRAALKMLDKARNGLVLIAGA